MGYVLLFKMIKLNFFITHRNKLSLKINQKPRNFSRSFFNYKKLKRYFVLLTNFSLNFRLVNIVIFDYAVIVAIIYCTFSHFCTATCS